MSNSHYYTQTSPSEGRTRLVCREETNLGNMLADATRAFYSCDIALVNSGGGAPLCIRDVIEICPLIMLL